MGNTQSYKYGEHFGSGKSEKYMLKEFEKRHLLSNGVTYNIWFEGNTNYVQIPGQYKRIEGEGEYTVSFQDKSWDCDFVFLTLTFIAGIMIGNVLSKK